MTNASRLLNGIRVLVAEDETLIAELIMDMLSSMGAETIGPASTVDEIISAVAGDPPDAVTLDVNLRGEFVYRAIPAIQQRKIPFIFVTAYPFLPDCPAALGKVPRVQKPFRAVELAAAFEKLLN